MTGLRRPSDRVSRRRRWRWAMLALLGVVLASAALAGALWTFKADVFPLKRILATRTVHVSDRLIAKAVGPLEGQDLLSVDTAAVAARLSALPYVRDAHVYRRFPDALEVRLREYAPVAEVRGADGSRWLVSDDGRILVHGGRQPRYLIVLPRRGVSPEPGGRLPAEVVRALPLTRLLKDPALWPTRFSIERLEVSESGRCTLVFPGGGELRLGQPTDLKRKLTLVRAIFELDLKSPLAYEYVDISSPPNFVTRPKGS